MKAYSSNSLQSMIYPFHRNIKPGKNFYLMINIYRYNDRSNRNYAFVIKKHFSVAIHLFLPRTKVHM